MTGTPFSSGTAPFVSSDVPDADFDQLRLLLLRRRRFDLASYKDPCIRRRLAKRVRTLGLRNMGEYLALLRRDEGELDALLASLSVHVSQFFRNPATFEALRETILPRLKVAAGSTGRKALRLWSAGCAAGEEAYSLALLCAEAGCRGGILGTDISAAVLASAREALYDSTRLAEVPPLLRERYFRAEGKTYRLDQRIRAMVQFGRHDLLAKTDFPPADLILCRNVLIYFSRAEQEKILCRFAASLAAGGVLVLGKTETLVGPARELFMTENLTERIYRRL